MHRPFTSGSRRVPSRLAVCHAERPKQAADPSPACHAQVSQDASITASRRSLLAVAATASLLRSPAALAEEQLTGTLHNDTLAYHFNYPTRTASGREIPLYMSRKPERYSSAAPLTADARQRMVAEIVSLGEGITYGMFVGPVSGPLKNIPPSDWTARQVANTVLTDRSSARTTTGQRVPLATLDSAEVEERDGVKYYIYETIQQGSPNLYDPTAAATYRRSLCVTAARQADDGTQYLYTLALACPDRSWSDLQGGFREAVDSFRLMEPGKNYVSPERDPWWFF